MWLFPLLVLAITVALSVPAGWWLAWIMDEPARLPDWLRQVEKRFDTGPQTWQQYAAALLLFNALLFALGYVLLALQPLLPLNPDNKGMLAPSTIFHTVLSFVTNNSQQHYTGEVHLSYFSQLTVIVGNMFLGGGVSMCALVAVIRGLRGDPSLGNFYVDLWRSVAYVLVPASLIAGVFFLASGTPMTFDKATDATPTEKESMGKDDKGNIKPQTIARGPVAALVPIKNLASVGGGFFGANSSHPFESPSPEANLLTCVCILLFPSAVMVMFGRMLHQMRHAAILFGVMVALLAGMTFWAVHFNDARPNPSLLAQPAWAGAASHPPLPVDQSALGNLEGAELRHAGGPTGTFVAITTAVACGSVNCMHDSLNPLAGLSALTGMWLNCVFGGKGVGLVNLLLVLIVTVFLTGLMVGRTPEYLGKKVEAREMKLAMLGLLVHPVLVLVPTALFVATSWAAGSTSNPGPHGFTQVLYELTSASSGNGSGFEGLGDTYGFNDPQINPSPAPYSIHWDVTAGLVMLLGRFMPIVAALALAGSLAAKKPVPFTVGTLRTDTITFGLVLLVMVLLLGGLVFLPAGVLGPVAEHFGPIPFGH
jgi:K+-transporting ATPase ATPase A chain